MCRRHASEAKRRKEGVIEWTGEKVQETVFKEKIAGKELLSFSYQYLR